uniref:Uncharacterized protein n=1 Tax=Solanum tuberosum TaxID=4113 RepID=M1DGC5_SOLTU
MMLILMKICRWGNVDPLDNVDLRVVETMSLWVVHITASDINGIREYSSNILDAEKCNMITLKMLVHVENDAFACSYFEHFVFVVTQDDDVGADEDPSVG